MLEIARFGGGSDCFELDLVEREATPESAMKPDFRLHLANLSRSDTISILNMFGVEHCRTTVHDWLNKVDLQLLARANLDVAIDETVIQLNDERFWLYAAANPTRTACYTSSSLR